MFLAGDQHEASQDNYSLPPIDCYQSIKDTILKANRDKQILPESSGPWRFLPKLYPSWLFIK